jgi:CRP/FNR family transcriptional regulator, dissimilatory nitrate respiration regulator
MSNNAPEIRFMLLLAALEAIAVHRQLAVQQTLFHKGDAAVAFFAVQTGRIKLVRYLENGMELCLYVARSGESFAEAALFSETYHCDAIADIPSQITVYPKQDVLQILRTQPELALEFTALLAQQTQFLRTRLALHNVHSAHHRTLQYLLLLKAPQQDIIEFDRPLKNVASEIGLTHESFYRALARLESKGYISRDRRQIKLLQSNYDYNHSFPVRPDLD